MDIRISRRKSESALKVLLGPIEVPIINVLDPREGVVSFAQIGIDLQRVLGGGFGFR